MDDSRRSLNEQFLSLDPIAGGLTGENERQRRGSAPKIGRLQERRSGRLVWRGKPLSWSIPSFAHL